MRCVEAVDRLRERKGTGANQYTPKNAEILTLKNQQPPSHHHTADLLGIKPSKVSEIRAVTSDPEAREAVESGERTIHRAAQEVMK